MGRSGRTAHHHHVDGFIPTFQVGDCVSHHRRLWGGRDPANLRADPFQRETGCPIGPPAGQLLSTIGDCASEVDESYYRPHVMAVDTGVFAMCCVSSAMCFAGCEPLAAVTKIKAYPTPALGYMFEIRQRRRQGQIRDPN